MTDGAQAVQQRIRYEFTQIDAQSIGAFRSVLCESADGKQVLTWILSVLGFFSTADASAEEALLQDVGKLILARCGVWHAERMGEIVEQLVALPGVVPEYNRDKER